jgi:predicted transcriptional regulator of viral defense system
MNVSSYAQSQGIRLLEAAVQELGPLFTRQALRPLAERQGLSDGHLSQLLSRLNASGQIAILKRGVYLVRSPLYAGEIHPFAIAAALVQPVAISHWSALAHHGFTTQLPEMVQATTTAAVITPEMRRGQALRPRQRAVWRALDVEIEYIHVQPQRFFGHQSVWVDSWHRVAITDPERTALDLFARPEIFGGLRAALEILEENLPRLDLSRLVQYALRYGMGALIKRLGWSLEQMGVSDKVVAPLRDYPVKAWYRLDPRGEGDGRYNPRWHIVENLRRGSYA